MSYWNRYRRVQSTVHQHLQNIYEDDAGLDGDACASEPDDMGQWDQDETWQGSSDDSSSTYSMDVGFSATSDLDLQEQAESNHLKQFRTLLASWAVKNHIKHSALSELLIRLRVILPDLPKDARTLLSTGSIQDIKSIDGGSYYHFGLANQLGRLMEWNNLLPVMSTITLQLNIDGLPLFKSNTNQLWAILATVSEAAHRYVLWQNETQKCDRIPCWFRQWDWGTPAQWVYV